MGMALPYLELCAIKGRVHAHKRAPLRCCGKHLAILTQSYARQCACVRLYKLGPPDIVEFHPHLHSEMCKMAMAETL